MQNTRIDRYLRAGIVVLVGALVYVISGAIYERVIAAGDTAPVFTVQTENNRTVSLPNFGGKLLVLNFWATWCPPCVEETPSLSEFAKQYASRGVVVLGISVDKDEQAYRAFLNRFKPAFLTVREDKIHEDYGTYMYPETYIIDPSGKVLRKYMEPVNWMSPAVTSYINSLL
jgi:cytochrome c biogenesis protein CcmG, thiol:disulfide interchange protein DsbE